MSADRPVSSSVSSPPPLSPARPDTACVPSTAHRFCVAPMMDLTDRHARYFLRQLSRRARLYTEMITTGALLHGDRRRFLRFDPSEHPVAIQLGGSDPAALAQCARLAEAEGYDEVNLNVGCPSDRVQSGRFGACLMAEPALVADCVAAMTSAVRIPVTVKTRIGIDRDDSTERLYRLVDAVVQAGCTTLVVHARNAWLDGLSPKDNREIPPLRYAVVDQLKRDRPHLAIVLNGGLTTLGAAQAALDRVDGVMLGRAAYYSPWLLAEVDRALFDEPASSPVDAAVAPTLNAGEVVETMIDYACGQLAQGTPLTSITRHMLGLFQGVAGARAWRRTLSERAP
ncbi:MAG: tRNA dihydrouridine(20/20a) synthase DusA, partial [Proteobacteria bacterium]|nr:tRNA dihydrouridine(20/20a) synthase DusA [Burkholderiales bacterium]